MVTDILPHIILAVLGLCAGSFCNVLIFRIPRGEEFVKTSSHCMSCGHKLAWFENIPIVSWLVQRGKCRSCGAPVSRQYPAVEAINGLLWLLTVIAVIDWRTFEIPDGLNLAILVLGLVRLFTDLASWRLYLIGLICVSLFFLLIWILTGGAGIGMGDVKLMGAAGLLLGWKNILMAMFVGCIIGAVIHIIRMKRGAERRLAFGPYLAAGMWLAAMFGDMALAWYLGLFGF